MRASHFSMVIGVLLGGCSNGPDNPVAGDDDDDDATVADPLEASCVENTVIPTVMDCSWSSGTTGAGFVELWPDGEEALLRATPAGPEGTTHAAAVLGMKAGVTYAYRVVVLGADGARVEGTVHTHDVPPPPSDFPVFVADVHDPARSRVVGNYVLTSVVVPGAVPYTAIVIIDSDGEYVWWYRAVDFGLAITPRFSVDGDSIRFLTSDIQWLEDIGTITRVALDGSEVVETRALLGHHAIWENSDGTLAWLGFDYATYDDVEWASDVIRVAEEGSDELEPVETFSWFDAYAVEPWSADPGTNQVSLGDALEWTHSNSLMALDDDFYYIMSKKLDCVLKIDRLTGEIVWQLGGTYGDFTHPGGAAVWRTLYDNDLFSHAHMSQIWDGGMVVFDNGFYNGPGMQSRAVEYAFDEATLTVEEVWRYEQPLGRFTGTMGDVRKLDNGNYLIGWSSLSYIDEVTPDQEPVWQVSLPGGAIVGRVLLVDDLYNPPDATQP